VEKIFLNDKLVDVDKACIGISDAGLLYGAGLFETMRCYDGVVFRLEDHLERLFNSAAALMVQNTFEKSFIEEAIYATIQANNITDARLRLTLTSGAMSESVEKRVSTLLITATKMQTYPAAYYEKGVLVILSPYRQNPFEPTTGHKSLNYFSRITALGYAHQKNAAEAIWFTIDNRLAEGCISNVFLVKDSVLYTPTLATPVLPGIARKTITQTASENSIKLVEKDLFINDVLAADEIFLTNVIMQVMPITGVEKHTVGDGKVGPMVKELQKKYDEYVANYVGQNK
jgi:branched-chain amino acid aminotransferase